MISRFGFLDVRGRRPILMIVRREAVMQIRRVMVLCVALFFAASSLPLAQKAEKDEKKRSKQEQQDIEALVKMVDNDDRRDVGREERREEGR
jgi:hypothetical protein